MEDTKEAFIALTAGENRAGVFSMLVTIAIKNEHVAGHWSGDYLREVCPNKNPSAEILNFEGARMELKRRSSGGVPVKPGPRQLQNGTAQPSRT
ncbi:MAG TPA: hypothetical protein VHB73_04555 [Alphaproteobacteria bacterium]|nr:hypothetical protein [Alphaproteobacteria bacterium]